MRSAPVKSVITRLESWRFAPLRFAPTRNALLRFAPQRFVPRRHALPRLAPLRSAPLRSASLRLGRMLTFLSRHAFPASRPLRELRDVIVVRHTSHVSNSSSVLAGPRLRRRLRRPIATVLRASTIIARNVLRVSRRYRTAENGAPRRVLAAALSGASVARLDRMSIEDAVRRGRSQTH